MGLGVTIDKATDNWGANNIFYRDEKDYCFFCSGIFQYSLQKI